MGTVVYDAFQQRKENMETVFGLQSQVINRTIHFSPISSLRAFVLPLTNQLGNKRLLVHQIEIFK